MGENRYSKYEAIIARATTMGLMDKADTLDRTMDIESADLTFKLRLDDWLKADDFNFTHDFFGIVDNINRGSFPATDFGFFIPRFARSKCAEGKIR